ncbi:Concanavalin A-like lectin [Venustampulla echinocandica]|uniref:Crh-like protein n=1 Tax=Venustampulla echinocandica TaxID=2656787 RepID=A0A370U1V1_9HELO|nr:Concanavalin A-like lectin [Venustampulla echinocandica]RDL41754.1 Concanavalin A-like lectin [Venustampulla echinocandica]
MRTTFSAAAAVLAALQLVQAQTFTDCDPTKKTCPSNPGLGTTLTTDFTKGKSDDWKLADGTTLSYDAKNGANFEIKTKTNAPTISMNKFIMFGKVTVELKAAPGAGIVSSFILESDDLDEIDWEWIGSTDTSVESNFFGKGNTTTYNRAIYHDMADPLGSFHTYEIDWTKESIKWSIDGKVVRTLPYDDPLTLGGANYPQTPMQVKMGSWVGCADAAAAADPKTKGTCDWAGGPADFTKGPFSQFVKSVTVQDYGCGGEYTYGDLTGSYQSIKSSGKCDGKGSSDSSSSASKSATSTKNSSSSASAKPTASANSTSSASPTGSNSTTLTTATPTGAGGNGNSNPTGSATNTAGGAAQTSASAASSVKPQRQYGFLDMSVMALGLGLGYLVM